MHLIISTRFLWFLIALKYPLIIQTLIYYGILSLFNKFLAIVTNFDSSRIWHILVYVIIFTFFTFWSMFSVSSSFGDVKIKLTGTKKGYKSLKQYVSSKYLTDYTGVEYLTFICFYVLWKEYRFDRASLFLLFLLEELVSLRLSGHLVG